MDTADSVIDRACSMPLAVDSFDVAVEGFAELVAADRLQDAERVARETFRHAAMTPEWAAAYGARD